jgi:hypothetical protein
VLKYAEMDEELKYLKARVLTAIRPPAEMRLLI